MSNYRVLVSYDTQRSVFVARAPELEHCSTEGATRTEALAKLEEEIDAQLRNMREHGTRAPAPIDEDAGLAGELSTKISKNLHRDLAWQARTEGIELGQLVAEILAGGLEARRQRGGRRQPNAAPEPRAPETGGERGDRGPARNFGREGRGQGGRYHAIMEDRATFLEYVRNLDQPGGRGGPPYSGGGRGGPRRDRGPGPGPGPGPGSGRGRPGGSPPAGGQAGGGGQNGPPGGGRGPGGSGSDDDDGEPTAG